jgi:type I restriction-modification system DNA methylase subunit
MVRFYTKPVKDDVASAKEGRDIFADQEYIEIRIPGDRDGVNRPMSDGDRHRFAKAYADWKARGQAAKVEGTPLEMAPFLTRGQVEEMKYFNVTTVEGLADLPDIHAQKFMGLVGLKQKAKAYLAVIKENAPIQKLQAQLDEKDAKLKAMEQLLKEQGDKIESLSKRR